MTSRGPSASGFFSLAIDRDAVGLGTTSGNARDSSQFLARLRFQQHASLIA